MRNSYPIGFLEKFEKQPLLKLFQIYMLHSGKLSSESIYNYTRALKKVELFIYQNKSFFSLNSLFCVDTLEQLSFLINSINNHPDFISFNDAGHRMFSAALSKYYQFIKSCEDLKLIENFIDKPEPVISKERLRVINSHRGNNLVVRKVLEFSGWKCEHNPNHTTFKTKDTYLHDYMEGHHIIPLQFQDYFDVSLHVYSNIICLCPICHRQMHYGLKDDKVKLFRNIYNSRKSRLLNAGITLSLDNLTEMIFSG